MIQLLLSLVMSAVFAQIPEPVILQGDGVRSVTLEQSLQNIQPGSILVLGEEHGNAVHQNYQLRILKHLRAQGLKVSVGMEFLEYPHQAQVDVYRQGLMSDNDFINAVRWGQGFDFGFYRDQILFPTGPESLTVALNLPREISRQIAKGGVASLTPEQAAKLPPLLERGNEKYFRRFMKAAGSHLPTPEMAENYFMAQSSWDDTMAWQATQFLQNHPDQVLVIIVGEFHVQYSGGLPDRLQVWGAKDVTTVSLVNLAGLTAEERQNETLPSTEDGPRADFLWISEF
jgi:uncharacterized iron-regulated protein